MIAQRATHLQLWYDRMVASGELDTVIRAKYREWDAFQAYFTEADLLVESCEHGPLGVMWFTPLVDAGLVGVWIAPEVRRTRRGLAFAHRALQWGLSRYPTLVVFHGGATPSPLHTHAGFVPLGVIPKLRDGHDCWVAVMTPASLEAALAPLVGHG